MNTWVLLAGGFVVLYLLSRYTETGRKIVQQISNTGVKMIAEFEGFSAKSYNDPPGSSKWSIGFGHQILPGEPYMTREITVEEGRALLAADTAKAQQAVRETIKVPLTPAQFDSLTSFVYNVGVTAFKTGTVPSKINSKNFVAAAATMRQYNKAGGAINKALIARRDVEASAFA